MLHTIQGISRTGCLNLVLALCLSGTARLFAEKTSVQPEDRPWYHYIREEMPEPKIPEIQRFRLKNGIEVYYLKSDTVPLVHMQIIVDGGGFEVPEDKLGLHSLWGDTVVFSGSEKLNRDSLSNYLESRASAFSFTAGTERSTFNLRSMAHYFERDLQTVFEVLQKPRLAGEDFELLRKRVLQELERRDENPAKWAALGMSRLYWGDTLRGRYATRRTVTALKTEDLREWHNRIWRGERLSVAISGSVEASRLQKLLNATLGQLTVQPKEAPDLKKMHVSHVAKGNELRLLPKEIPQTTVIYRAPGMKHTDPDYYALRILDFLLGGDSFNSYLTQKIRTEKGWAYTAYSSFETDDFTGSLVLFTQTANNSLPDVLALMDSILAQPKQFIDAKKIEQAKLSLRNKFVFLFENPAQYMKLYLQLKWDGLPDTYLANYAKNLSKVTEADVLRVARKYYRPEKFTVLLCGPKDVYQKKSALRPDSPQILELEK
ncbi:MAG: M16 family metallopeptidase [Spirochaetota bacterium]